MNCLRRGWHCRERWRSAGDRPKWRPRIRIVPGFGGGSGCQVGLGAEQPALQEEIQKRGAKLVIIDPLMAFLSGSVDSNKDQDIRRCLQTLAKVAEKEDATILFLRHLNKAAGTKAIYRGGGSIGIIGAVRVGLLVAQDPGDSKTRATGLLEEQRR